VARGDLAPAETGVVAQGLTKRFGSFTAVDAVDFVVAPGTVVGLLGPNGAGKTTAIRMFTTLRRPDAGRATVCFTALGVRRYRQAGAGV
jgi:ABC-type multidrug transport system ATPase subunit